jgi:hypothetical protein
MKKVLHLLFFVASFFAKGQTSVYHPFPDSNAVWIVRGGCTNSFTPSCILPQCEVMTRYEQTNDTIINSKFYHKITSSSSWSCSPPTCTQPCMPVDYSEHYIREDSTKRIWELNTFYMTDTLLYDFNLNVGDTINTMLSNIIGWDYVVQSIDSVWIGNSWRSRYNYSSSGGPESCTQFLIEGIGGGGGLFSPLCALFCFESGNALLCFQHNNEQYQYPDTCLWMGDTATFCNFHVPVPEIGSEKNTSIFPNPATNQLEIRNAEHGINEIEIYNVTRKKVMQFQIRDSPSFTTIDISGLQAGLYFVQLKSSKNSVTKKLVIVR